MRGTPEPLADSAEELGVAGLAGDEVGMAYVLVPFDTAAKGSSTDITSTRARW